MNGGLVPEVVNISGETGALTMDRRLSHRFTLRVPTTLVLPDSGLKVRGKTRDISSGGVFFYANLPVAEQQEIELLMTLPFEFSVVPVRVACRAKVLRVEMDEVGGAREWPPSSKDSIFWRTLLWSAKALSSQDSAFSPRNCLVLFSTGILSSQVTKSEGSQKKTKPPVFLACGNGGVHQDSLI
jgi:hypothetical protein